MSIAGGHFEDNLRKSKSIRWIPNSSLPSPTGSIIMFRNGVASLKVAAFRKYLTLPDATGILDSSDVATFGLI